MWRAAFYLIVFIVSQVVAAALAMVVVDVSGGTVTAAALESAENAVPVGVSILVVEGLLSLAVVWWMRAGRRLRLFAFLRGTEREMAGNGCSAADYVCAVAGVLALAYAFSQVSDMLSLPDGGTDALFEAMCHDPLCLLLICVVGPLTEELIFRAGVVRCLFLRGLPGWLAAVVAAAAFGVVHGNLAQAVPAFGIGVALGLLYLRSGDLRLCLPAHMANNTLGVITLWVPSFADVESSWVAAAVSFLLGVVLLWRVLRAGGTLLYRVKTK